MSIIKNTNRIEVKKEPELLNFGHNPIYFITGAEEYTNVTNIPSYINFKVNALPAENEYIEINGYRYVFKNVPTYNQIVATGTTQQIAEDIYHVLSEDPRLNYNYDIIINEFNYEILIKSKLVGDAYNITFTSTSANVYATAVVNSSNRFRSQGLNNYSQYVEIFKGDNFFFGQDINNIYNPTFLDSIERDYQVDNNYYFDLSPILNKYQETQTPRLDSTNIEKYNGWIDNFSVKFGESYSANATDKYKRKFQIGKAFEYWVCNSAVNIFDNVDRESYYTRQVNASCIIDFNVTYGSFDKINFKGTNFNLTAASTFGGLITSVNNFVNAFNASSFNSNYIAIANSNQVVITALQVGSQFNFTITTTSPNIKITQDPTIQGTQSLTTTNGFAGLQSFLTNQPSEKLSNKDSIETLYFLWKRNIQLNPYFFVRHVITFYDDSITEVLDNYITQSDFGGLYGISFNIDNIITQFEQPDKVRYVTSTVCYKFASASVSYSELTVPQRYIISEDIEYRNESKTNFLFQNKFGVFDTCVFNGLTTYTVNRDSKSYKTAYLPTTSQIEGIERTLSTTVTPIEVYNSGWISKAQVDWLKEILSSLRVYKINGLKYEIVNVIDSSYEYNDKSDLYSMSITIRKTYDENYVSY